MFCNAHTHAFAAARRSHEPTKNFNELSTKSSSEMLVGPGWAAWAGLGETGLDWNLALGPALIDELSPPESAPPQDAMQLGLQSRHRPEIDCKSTLQARSSSESQQLESRLFELNNRFSQMFAESHGCSPILASVWRCSQVFTKCS